MAFVESVEGGTFVGHVDIWPSVGMFGHVCVNNVSVV